MREGVKVYQGQTQLGISWGSAEEPNCRDFTSDEITKINFDKLDLTPIYADLGPIVPDQKVLKRNITNRLNHMRNSMQDRSAM